MRHPDFKPFSILCLLALALSCSHVPFFGDKEPSTPQWLQGRGGSYTVVVLPFENLTSEPDLENLVRKSFHSHFTLKNYRDIEFTEVDRALEMLCNATSKPWKEHSSAALGEFFHAEFAVYGKVLDYSKLFAGIYSQIAIEVQVEMVDCRTGSGVWWKTLLKRSHEGGVPFTLFGIIPEALRSGLHMQKERTVDLIERVSRELVEEIPEPPIPSFTPFFLDVQAASFLERGLAEKAQQDLQQKGHPARVESVLIGDRTWHRLLLGPFREAAEAEKVKASLSGEPGFKPILIYHQAENSQKGTPGLR